VHEASVLDALTTRVGATQAMHTNLKKEGSGVGSSVQNVTDDGIFVDYHITNRPFEMIAHGAMTILYSEREGMSSGNMQKKFVKKMKFFKKGT
jgi:hypothetical protein